MDWLELEDDGLLVLIDELDEDEDDVPKLLLDELLDELDIPRLDELELLEDEDVPKLEDELLDEDDEVPEELLDELELLDVPREELDDEVPKELLDDVSPSEQLDDLLVASGELHEDEEELVDWLELVLLSSTTDAGSHIPVEGYMICPGWSAAVVLLFVTVSPARSSAYRPPNIWMCHLRSCGKNEGANPLANAAISSADNARSHFAHSAISASTSSVLGGTAPTLKSPDTSIASTAASFSEPSAELLTYCVQVVPDLTSRICCQVLSKRGPAPPEIVYASPSASLIVVRRLLPAVYVHQ